MSSNIVWHEQKIAKIDRVNRTKQRPAILWFTGLSGSGKSTIANSLEERLYKNGNFTYLLDGDNVRHGLNRDLGFDDKSRIENIRRVGEVSKLFVDSGLIVLTAFISPFESDRDIVRELVEDGEFIDIFVDTPINICESRDPKGLYKKARAGEIPDFTGVSSPYEAPENPKIHIKNLEVEEATNQIMEYLKSNRYIIEREDSGK
jgi:adenylylsulfate kinase